MITEKTTIPQASNCGMGWGILEGIQNKSLKEVLEFIKENFKTWGTCSILDISDNTVIRKFDYDLYNNDNKIFYYHHLNWELGQKVHKVKFSFCYMKRDITIEVE